MASPERLHGTGALQPPIVQYGKENKNIPGDPTGWKLKDCGNICHWGDAARYGRFPDFSDSEITPSDTPKVQRIHSFLEDMASNGLTRIRAEGEMVEETDDRLIIDSTVEGLRMRTVQLKDVSCASKESYKKSDRAKKLAAASATRMNDLEPAQTRDEENYLMAKRISIGEAPPRPPTNPTNNTSQLHWYKSMRLDANRAFWLRTSRQERDEVRAAAQNPADELLPIIEQIRTQDKTHSKDHFWEYQRDETAIKSPSLYEHFDQDIVLFVDKDADIVACRFSGLFQLLFALPPLPIPDTDRHMVDELIRQHHPELDIEKAQCVEEIEQRAQCVVHYGTWAMKGHRNPDDVFLTVDTLLARGRSRKVEADYVSRLLPTFTKKVLGIGSEVARFLFRSLAPKEYQECCDVFEALPEVLRVPMSTGPTFASLSVLGINSFTARHSDKTDVKFGLASLVPLGQYEGGDICFPQLAAKLTYRRGDGVLFRGAELEHFVGDWTGYRVFLLYTNHQPVRNYAHRRRGRLPPKPNDPWHPDRLRAPLALAPESEPDPEAYDPCYAEPLSPDPEALYETDVHGAGYLGKRRLPSDESSRSADGSDWSRGELVVAGPEEGREAKRPRVDA
ncbi:hypothetical protein F4780DRAFT_796150 [Xylariomycetidae sp. FL0641]|nr:hypothetical protein F4780DRAFT_796150 [Xylariomycetidae sp. FL0641]